MRAATAQIAGLALIVLAAPANAQDRGAYIAADTGAVLPVEFDSDIGPVREDATSTGDLGWGGSVRAGYDWDWLRIELEGSYQSFGADEISVATQGLPDTSSSVRNGTFDYDGDFSLASLMANTLAEFGEEDGVRFSVGGGVGRSWMNADTALVGASTAYLDASDSEWAWQALFEARVPVSDRVDLGLRYRYFSTLEFEVADTLDRPTQFELATHSLSLGLTVRLGGGRRSPVIQPTVPPVAAVEPVQPPRPERTDPIIEPPAPCERGPYIVFFDWDEAEITAQSASVLNSVTSAYQSCGDARVMIAGHADRSGPGRYNEQLSQERAEAVRDFLVERGIPANLITEESFGETQTRVVTPDGVRELQNRRVEIMFGPGSGS